MPESTEPANVEVAFTVKSRGHAIGDKVKVSKSEAERLEAAHLAKRTAKSAT
jgi:hypothetical protein